VIGDIASTIWQMNEDIVPQGTWKLALYSAGRTPFEDRAALAVNLLNKSS
jgi:hypothetical protein